MFIFSGQTYYYIVWKTTSIDLKVIHLGLQRPVSKSVLKGFQRTEGRPLIADS